MTLRKDARKSLIEFTNDVRIPDFLVTDGVMEFTSKNTKFVTVSHKEYTKEGEWVKKFKKKC